MRSADRGRGNGRPHLPRAGRRPVAARGRPRPVERGLGRRPSRPRGASSCPAAGFPLTRLWLRSLRIDRPVGPPRPRPGPPRRCRCRRRRRSWPGVGRRRSSRPAATSPCRSCWRPRRCASRSSCGRATSCPAGASAWRPPAGHRRSSLELRGHPLGRLGGRGYVTGTPDPRRWPGSTGSPPAQRFGVPPTASRCS